MIPNGLAAMHNHLWCTELIVGTGFDILQNMVFKIPSSNMAKSLKASRAEIRRQLELFSSSHFQKRIDTAVSSLEQVRQASRFSLAHQLRDIEWGYSLRQAAKEQLCLPRITEAEKMLREYKSSIGMTLQRYQEPVSNLKRAIESMRTPWIDMQNELQSLKGFATLQGIGHALRTMSPFGIRLVDALRSDLGDWRNETAWPPEIFIDPQARTSFYGERGLNPTLTAFPNDAFEQGVIIGNIRVDSIPLAEDYNFGLEIKTDTNEDLYRTIRAHNLIQCFETLIRKYIDGQMESVFGVTWAEDQVPSKILQRWLSRLQKAQRDGEREHPPIAYASFTDYVEIITQEDNWQNAFESAFGQKDSVRESFRRLVPIRNCVMHSRPITQDDELYLYVEIKRILAAIGTRV